MNIRQINHCSCGSSLIACGYDLMSQTYLVGCRECEDRIGGGNSLDEVIELWNCANPAGAAKQRKPSNLDGLVPCKDCGGLPRDIEELKIIDCGCYAFASLSHFVIAFNQHLRLPPSELGDRNTKAWNMRNAKK